MRKLRSIVILAIAGAFMTLGATNSLATAREGELATYIESGQALEAVIELTAQGTSDAEKGFAPGDFFAHEPTAIGQPFEVNLFSAEFARGDSASNPTTPSHEFVAAVISRDMPIGTVRFADEGGQLKAVMVDNSQLLASGIAGLKPGQTLIEDAPAAAWFTLEGDVLTTVFNLDLSSGQVDELVGVGAGIWS